MRAGNLDQEREHLADLLEALERCVYFLHGRKIKKDAMLQAIEIEIDTR